MSVLDLRRQREPSRYRTPAGAQLFPALGPADHDPDPRDRDHRPPGEPGPDAHHGRDNGYALGFDCGLGARPDFAAGLLAGLEAGNAERRQLARNLIDRMTPRPRPGRATDREAGQ